MISKTSVETEMKITQLHQINLINNIMKFKVFFLACLCLTAKVSLGQELQNLIPQSPEAAGLGKYGDIPVSTYTGVPNINIPLYTVKSGDLELPISLSYHASGIRVNEEASWVGLGWSLNAGGVITRVIRGKDDLMGGGDETGFLFNYQNMPDDPAMGHTYYIYKRSDEDQNPLEPFDPFHFYLMKDGVQTDYYDTFASSSAFADWSSDLYTFNFAGYAGKFLFDSNGQPQLINHQDLEVTYISLADGWSIKTPNGVIYSFSSKQKSGAIGDVGKITSWFLTSISSPSGGQIDLEYYEGQLGSGASDMIYSMPTYSRIQVEGSHSDKCYNDQFDEPKINYHYMSANYLKKIIFPSGYLEFVRNANPREDLKGAYRLEKIKVYTTSTADPSELLVKEFLLDNNGYFQGESIGNGYQSEIDRDDLYLLTSVLNYKRLKLSGVQEVNGTESNPPYIFEYDNTPLPAKTTFAQDHWGLFNGATNDDLMPPTYYSDANIHPHPQIIRPVIGTSYDGANREASAAHVTASLLERITYPTGGQTVFEYESNQYENTKKDTKEIVLLEASALKAPGTGSKVIVDGEEVNITAQHQDIFAKNLVIEKNTNYLTLKSAIPVVETNFIPSSHYPRIQVIGAATNLDTVLVAYPKGYSIFDDPEPDPTTGLYTYEFEFDHQVKLVPDTYQIIFNYFYDANSFSKSRMSFYLKIKERIEYIESPKFGGGVRIKAITQLDGIGSVPQTKEYRYSEGTLMNQALYNQYRVCIVNEGVSNGQPEVAYMSENLLRYSSPTIPLSTSASGGYVGYDNVEIWNGENAKYGKTTLKFHNNHDLTIQDVLPRLPGIPLANDTRNGLLKEQIEYANDHGVFRKVNSTTNLYPSIVSPSGNARLIWGIELSRHYNNTFPQFDFHQYATFTFWNKLLKKTEKIYSQTDENKYIEKVTEYGYDAASDHHQVTSQRFTSTSEQTIVTTYKYPKDYTYSTNSVIEKMVDANILAIPLESIHSIDDQVVAASATKFEHVASDDIIVPKEFYAYRTEIPGANFSSPANGEDFTTYEKKATILKRDDRGNVLSQQMEDDLITSYLWGYDQTLPVAQAVNATENQIAYSSFEVDAIGSWEIAAPNVSNSLVVTDATEKILILDFDQTVNFNYTTTSGGTLLFNQLGEVAGSITLVGNGSDQINLNKGRYRIELQASGTASATVSFEEFDITIASSDFRTGASCMTWSPTNALTKTGLSPGNYILSYWEKNGSVTVALSGSGTINNSNNGETIDGWLKVEKQITVTSAAETITLSGSGLIDELRLHPEHSQMMSFTYRPGFGTSSATDAKGQTIYYYYDELGRLTQIKDHEGHLLNKNEYKYVNPSN